MTTISISKSLYDQFCKETVEDGRRFGQRFFEFVKADKVTGENRYWFDKLYVADDESAKKMIAQVLDHSN